MRVICAWCEKFIKEKEASNDRIVSHGICDKCSWKVKGATIKRMKQKATISIPMKILPKFI